MKEPKVDQQELQEWICMHKIRTTTSWKSKIFLMKHRSNDPMFNTHNEEMRKSEQ
jgi:hypothetical protein